MSSSYRDTNGEKRVRMTIYGEPVAQGRPRFTTIHGHVQAIDPKKSKEYKQLIRLEAQFLFDDGFQVIEEASRLKLRIFRGIPESWSKKKKAAALNYMLRPTSRPDTDNYIKGVLDALNGIIVKDDSCIVHIEAGKYYSDRPRIEIEVENIRSEKETTVQTENNPSGTTEYE